MCQIVTGAVVSPGVYKVTNKMIVNDVITLAGGLLESADTSNLNLSKQLTKEMVITVFTKEEIKEEKIQKKAVNETNSEVTTKDDKINLNTAPLISTINSVSVTFSLSFTTSTVGQVKLSSAVTSFK